MRRLTFIFVPLYLAAIVIANIVTAQKTPLMFDFLGQTWVVTWGTFFIAATFFLRDAIQIAYGRAFAYGCIAAALLATVVLSRHYDDLFWVTIGSAASFAVSETLDTEIFTRLKAGLGQRVAVSGAAGGLIDSIIFAIIGLSPLTTNIVPWSALWTTVVAQVVVKCGANLLVGLTAKPVYQSLEAQAQTA